MTVSDDDRQPAPFDAWTRRIADTLEAVGWRLSRYDLVLAVVPAAFAFALAASTTLSVPPRVALTAASAVGALVVADALFVHPPMRGGRVN